MLYGIDVVGLTVTHKGASVMFNQIYSIENVEGTTFFLIMAKDSSLVEGTFVLDIDLVTNGLVQIRMIDSGFSED